MLASFLGVLPILTPPLCRQALLKWVDDLGRYQEGHLFLTFLYWVLPRTKLGRKGKRKGSGREELAKRAHVELESFVCWGECY
jgi:hypothetical protein